jgi:hypothetical protein
MIRFEESAELERSHGFRASCIEDPDEMHAVRIGIKATKREGRGFAESTIG